MRSCRREARPCQNSIASGTRRYPPQCGGQGTGRLASAKRASACGESGLQRRAPRDRLALRRRPRTELRRAGTPGEIGGRFRGFERRRDALDAHLPLEIGPEEEQRRVGFRRQLAALPAQVVREEHEAAVVEDLEQHDARGGPAVGIDRRERHRVGLDELRFHRLGEPPFELPVRVRGDTRFVERRALVLGAEVGDVHRISAPGKRENRRKNRRDRSPSRRPAGVMERHERTGRRSARAAPTMALGCKCGTASRGTQDRDLARRAPSGGPRSGGATPGGGVAAPRGFAKSGKRRRKRGARRSIARSQRRSSQSEKSACEGFPSC